MSQVIHYVKADPSGNTTIIVLDPIEKEAHRSLATRLLAPDCVGAEQVAFLTFSLDEDIDLRIDMMGGEFCGNASRSAAALTAMEAGKEKGSYAVSCSGSDAVLRADVQRKGEGMYDAFIDMPLPAEIEAVIVDIGGQPCRFFRVDFQGIVHYVHVTQDIQNLDKEAYWQGIRSYVGEALPPALGMVLFDGRQQQMIPAVYVPDTDTLYWEQSCGSGTAAVGAVMACMTKRDFSGMIAQPGGTLAVMAKADGGDVTAIRIGGIVTVSEIQEIVL